MKTTFFWFRRDLRLNDNHGLYKALANSENVIPIFIFDTNILDELPKDDARVTFIYDEVIKLKIELKNLGSDLIIRNGKPNDVWRNLQQNFEIQNVYANHDYEPYATHRDKQIQALLKSQDIEFYTFKDHVLFEKKEILTGTGGVYTVFTPYKRKWLKFFHSEYIEKSQKDKSFYPSDEKLANLKPIKSEKPISLSKLGFVRSGINIPQKEVTVSVIKNYEETRNFPGLEDSTSRLGVHFRFGTISIREKALSAAKLSETYLSELIWRDFYAQILANFPRVVDEAFRPKYDYIAWRNNEKEFEIWCEGNTGYPMVDAGMRELNQTGYMHNRVRMITASFLTKHLLIDWRWGEAYFAKKLLDYDLASNNGGWQWAAGSGTDAAPYFRIFNPSSQLEKFDRNRTYINRWIPELGTGKYPEPMVDHKFARERCLSTYKATLTNV